MFIPQTAYLEDGMLISYDTLLEKKKELTEKQYQRKSALQASAIALLREFKNSLSLPNEFTIDSEGRKTPYTDIFIKNENKLFEHRPPHDLQPDGKHQLEFYLGVMVNPGIPGGDWIIVPIRMWYEKKSLMVASGNEGTYLQVHNDDSDGRFYEAAAMIKKSLMRELIDPRLE